MKGRFDAKDAMVSQRAQRNLGAMAIVAPNAIDYLAREAQCIAVVPVDRVARERPSRPLRFPLRPLRQIFLRATRVTSA
jgi:hypothetical protein